MDKKDKHSNINTEFFRSFSRNFEKTQYLQFAIDTIRDFTHCNSVGIRLLNDDGFMPYEIYTGFSDDFWQSENLLNINYDQCVCTRLVNRRLEQQDLPVISRGGSFYTPNLQSFFEGLSPAESCRFRGKCVDYGYKGLAVIPIIDEDQTIGVLHLADERPDLLTDELLEFLETLTPLIGEAVRRYCLEDRTDDNFQALGDFKEKKLYEKRLEYLNFHDPVTGLYNRTYFNLQKDAFDVNKTTNLGLILMDIDGFRRLNEAMGQDEGDSFLKKFAQTLDKCFGSNCVVARIDGDEFGVIVPKTTLSSLEDQCRRFKFAVADILRESLVLNVSVGFALRKREQNIDDLFKEVEQNMEREKIHHDQSSRSGTINVLTEALKARDFITEGHANRLQQLVIKMAKSLGLSTSHIDDLRLFAEFHDLGKVGIPDYILFKDGPLTDEEWLIMKEHPSIGSRIAQSASDLVPISRWILCHHENWDGSGYPLGLKGNEIPLECRILSIADAYDAMTNDRPYRKAMTSEEAIMELKRCSGTQFDPKLIDLLLHEKLL